MSPEPVLCETAPSGKANTRVVIAEVLRPRGIQGEVVVFSQTDVPGRMEQLNSVNTQLANGAERSLTVTAAWPHKGQWVLKFSGIDSIEAAEALRGADLWLPLSERGDLGEGVYFRSDLVGCRLLDATSGQLIGTVEGWQEFGGPPLMEVNSDGREVLVPFVSAFCDIDLVARAIRAELPEGLLDL